LVSFQTLHRMLHSLAPSPLLFPFHQQPSALLVCELLFCFFWRVDCCVEWLFLHGDFLIEFPVCSRGVRTVVYIPSSTTYCCLRTCVLLMVLSSTGSTTVPWRLPYCNSFYIVPLLCSTYCTHGAVLYLEYHSTFLASIQQYYCSTLPSSSTVAPRCTAVLAVQFSLIVIALNFAEGGSFLLLCWFHPFLASFSHVFFLLFCNLIRSVVTTSVVCLLLLLCFD
jgi:hypothetical protein